MTSRERIIAAIRHEPVDRVPVTPFGFGHLNPREGVGKELLEVTDPFIPSGPAAVSSRGRGTVSASRRDRPGPTRSPRYARRAATSRACTGGRRW